MVAWNNVLARPVQFVKPRRGDLFKQHAGRVHQYVIGLAGHLGGYMGKQELIPAFEGTQPKRGRQIDPPLPFLSADFVLK